MFAGVALSPRSGVEEHGRLAGQSRRSRVLVSVAYSTPPSLWSTHAYGFDANSSHTTAANIDAMSGALRTAQITSERSWVS
jgi:phosphatidate phosphatase APP1